MNPKRTLILALIALISVHFFACDESIENTYKIKVASTVAGFSGYYFYDDKSIVPFSASVSSGAAVYEAEINNPEHLIRAYAVTADASATSLEIYLFNEGDEIKKIDGTRISSDSSKPFSGTLEYKIASTETTTTSGTSTTTK